MAKLKCAPTRIVITSVSTVRTLMIFIPCSKACKMCTAILPHGCILTSDYLFHDFDDVINIKIMKSRMHYSTTIKFELGSDKH